MSGRSLVDCSMMSSADSITSRLRSPRKSIFSRPSSSIGFIEYCVTVRRSLLPSSSTLPVSSASWSGTMLVSGSGAMTTAAAWIEELRTIPSSPCARSTICLACRVLGDRARQVLPRLEALLERRRAAHDRVRDQLRQPIARAVVEVEHARRVARGRAREHAAEGDDLRDAVAAVLVGDVAHDAVAALDREVDVDVRHRHALGVQEALEQQVVGERVDLGDVERVGDDRAGRRAAPGPDRDARVLGELDEVPDDQEVAREAHVLDHGELHLEPLDRLGRKRVAIPRDAGPRSRARAGSRPRLLPSGVG